MPYQIKSIDLFVRQIPPPRMDFSIGKGSSLFPEWMRANVEVRLMLATDDGRSSFGCAADWPSFGWLDKRPNIDPKQKLVELLELIQVAKQVFLANANFNSVFDCWFNSQADLLAVPQTQSAVPLCSSFAVALFERALIDAVCRIDGISFFEAIQTDRLGFDAGKIHRELDGKILSEALPNKPFSKIHVKHTVSPTDPLTESELTPESRLNDGLPQTLDDYVRRDGIRYFKIKICGDPASDFNRLQNIWAVIHGVDPTITLDGNEAYDDLVALREFMERLATEQPVLFDRVQFIEQPMSRARTNDPACSGEIRSLAAIKPLIIDEADGDLNAFKEALEIGYSGVSHKNCKGIFKSLANYLLCQTNADSDRRPFLSAEDLTVMPVVSLQQDLAVVSAFGLTNVERNAHHFFAGLAHLTDTERASALRHYPSLYELRNTGVFMKISDGQIDISDLQCSGLGVVDEPDFGSMGSLEDWVSELKAALKP